MGITYVNRLKSYSYENFEILLTFSEPIDVGLSNIEQHIYNYFF